MFDRVVMNKETRKTILSLVRGKEEDLDKWGVKTTFQKGTGKTFLAFGPPGAGKTMTGEALAELLERPLYIVDSKDFGTGIESFERGLCEVIEKTERWNSVTVIDEAELILQTREASLLDSSMRVAAVLRNLEKLQKGILWLTTNRPIEIDFAIESRIRAQIYFPFLNARQRRTIWETSLPPHLPVSGLKERLDELAEIPINGREIRNVIVNAAEQASSEGLKRVPADYLLAWAKIIPKNQEVLRKAKKDSRQYGSIGFLHKS